MTDLPFNNLTIDGFRGLRELGLEKLSTINVLVGENNSGKTSVLEAISIVCNPFNPYEWNSMVRRRDYGGLDETRIQSLRWCFPQIGNLNQESPFESKCRFDVSGSFPLRRLAVVYRDITGFPSQKEIERILRRRRGSPDELDTSDPWHGAEITHHIEMEGVAKQIALFDDETLSGIETEVMTLWEKDWFPSSFDRRRYQKVKVKTDTLTPYSYQLNRLQVQSYSQKLFESSDEQKRRSEVVIELAREFDPDILDIQLASVRGERPAIYVLHTRHGPSPISIFGDALRRAVLLAGTLEELKGGGVLLIDEVEAGIHVDALKHVFSWLIRNARKLDVQIFATTHSLEAVDAILSCTEDHLDLLNVYNLEQKTDHTCVKRIAGDVVKRLRQERGLDVR